MSEELVLTLQDALVKAALHLASAGVASCECLTMSPDWRNHREGCRYRNIMIALEYVEAAISRAALPAADQQPNAIKLARTEAIRECIAVAEKRRVYWQGAAAASLAIMAQDNRLAKANGCLDVASKLQALLALDPTP